MKVSKIAQAINATVQGNPEFVVTGAASLETAGPDDICLYLGGRYKKDLERTKARVLVVNKDMVAEGFTLLRVDRPRLMFSQVIRLFHPEKMKSGIHPRAFISEKAVVGRDVYVGANACVGDNTTIGDGTEIHEGCVLYEDVVIGRDCRIYASVVIREGTIIGDRVIIQPGAVIGADGFGFEPDEKGVFHKIPQVGRVVIEDDVEIGANTCVDRAALGETRIGRGTKVDNLCQFGHGDKIGSDTVISGMTGISGSVTIGNHVIVGGNAGVVDHVTIGDRVIVAGRAGVTRDVPDGSIVAGFPHQDIKTWKRAMVTLYRMSRKKGSGSPEEDKG